MKVVDNGKTDVGSKYFDLTMNSLSILVLFNFLPLILGYSYKENTTQSNLYDSIEYSNDSFKIALTSSAIMAVPLFLLLLSSNLFDRNVYKLMHTKGDARYIADVKSKYHSELAAIIIVVLSLISAVYTIYIGLPLKQVERIFVLFSAQDSFLLLFFAYNLHHNSPHYFNVPLMLLLVVPRLLRNLVTCIQPIVDVPSVVPITCSVTVLCVVLYFASRWFTTIAWKYSSVKKLLEQQTTQEMVVTMTLVLLLLYTKFIVCRNSFEIGYLEANVVIAMAVSIAYVVMLQRINVRIFATFQVDGLKSEALLRQSVPSTVATNYLRYGTIAPESHKNVTIFFSDVEAFTSISSRISPVQVSTCSTS